MRLPCIAWRWALCTCGPMGTQVQGAIDAGVYDGPVGFGAGIAAGFVMFFAGMLAILNGIGLWRLFRRPSRAQMQK